jgi:hypothetical protein
MSISLVDVANYYQRLPHQMQALHLLQTQIESTHPQLIADSSEFVKTWQNTTSSSNSPTSSLSVALVDVAKYYKSLPHQIQALQLLQQQLEAQPPRLLADDGGFALIWRNQQPSYLPEVQTISNNTQLSIKWQGKSYTIDANTLNVLVLDSVDPATGKLVDRTMNGQRFIEQGISIDPQTGNIAVGVLLTYYAATNFSAIFIIKLEATGGYGIYRVQVPGVRPLPNEFATYPLDTIKYVRFVDEDLFVKEGDASGKTKLYVFQPSNTPAMKYAGEIQLAPPESS